MAIDDFSPGGAAPPVVRNLSVSSQVGSSQFQSQSLPSRRPHGARRRGGLLAGLRIVNPDDSDEDEAEASKRPGGPGRTASVGSGGSSSGAPITPSESPDASSTRIPSVPATPRAPPPSAPMPTVPAPLSSPLPSVPAFPPSAPSGSSSFLVGSPNQFDGTIMSTLSPAPPTPPPRPERHLQRAFTSPSSDPVKIHPEPLRHTSAGSVQKVQNPTSPPRTLPPLPSAPGSSRQSQGAVSPASTSPSPFSAGSGSSLHHNPLPIPPLAHGHLPPLPSSTSMTSSVSTGVSRVDSPESIMSPAASSSSARRGSSLAEASGRHKMLLQATCDNEQFTIVDVTKATSGDAILDLVLSKMQFRDDEYDSLSLYRTDIGEAADPYPTPPSDLYNFCTQHGDAKGTLKFLIKQTKIPTSSNASVIPPPGVGFEHESVRYTPNVDRRQGGSVSWAQQMELGGPRRSPSRHSKDGSMSSASEHRSRGNNGEPTSPARYAARSIGDGHETDTSSNSRGGGVKRSRVPNGRRLPSSPSRSPMGEHHPSMFENIIHGQRSVSAAASPVIIPPSPIAQGLRHSASLELELSPGGHAEDDHRLRQGSITPTPYTGQRRFASEQSSEGTSLPYLDGPGSAGLGIRNVSSGSSSRPTMSPLTIPNSSFAAASPSMDGMDQETRDLILRLDAEERERERAQFEADRELALKEQQSEQEVWEAMQQLERTERERQVRADAVRAQRVEAEEREQAAQREAQDLERREYDRQIQLSQERRERRQHFQGIPRQGDIDRTMDDWRDSTTGSQHPEASRHAGYDPAMSPSQQYPHTPSNYAFQTSPPTVHSPEGTFYPDRRRPSGVLVNPTSVVRAQETQHAQDRLHDPRLQHVGGVPANRPSNRPTSSGSRRNTPAPRIVHPFAYTGPTGGTADAAGRSASLQAARSMDSMRPSSAMSHPYQLQPGGIHHHTRAPGTPAPENTRQHYYGQGRDYSPDQVMRADSPERPSSTAPGGPHTSGYSATVQFPEAVPFPSPQATGSTRPWPERATSPRAEGRTPRSLQVNTRPQQREQSYDYRESGSSRPQTVHYDRSPPVPSSPDMPPRRPSTIYSHSPPASQAGHFESNPSSPRFYSNSPRLQASQRSPTLAARDRRTSGEGADRQRRTSHSSNTANDYDGHLQAAMTGLLSTNRPEDMRSMSEASTATVRGGQFPPPYISDDPTATMRAEQWLNETATSFTAESTITDGTFRPSSSQPQPDFDDDDAEATLFIKPPSAQPSANTTLSRTPAVRPSPGKLVGAIELQAHSRASLLDPEGTGLGPWARPKPDVMYDNLQEFFPGVDLDKPIFDVAAAPVESPAQSPLRQDHPPMPVPRPAASAARSSFNKAENRKSIRVVADRAKSRLSKVGSMVSEGLIRRRSTAMWNHKIAEVTKIKPGEDIQVPTAIPESPAATTVDEKPPADTFQWVKGRLIGSGSFGSVYIAFNVSNAEMIAVKQVAKSTTGQANAKQQGMIKALKEEMLILKDIDHVNIVRYLGFDESPEFFSMFLEYVEGGTIRTLYRTFGVLEDNMVKSFTKQLTEGLIYLHDRRVWHRDIKSENILVDNEGVVKISDFGISKKHSNNDEEQMTQTGYRGTFAWMAPEVYLSETRGDKIEYNSKIDIWSLGCLVLEMLTAQVPWSSIPGGMFGVFRAVTAGKRPSVPEGMTLAPDAYSFIYDKTVVTAPASRCEGRALLREPFLTSLDPNWRFELSSVGMAAVSAAIEQAQKLRADKV